MNIKYKISILVIILFLLIGITFTFLQPTTPVHFGRLVFVNLLKKHISKSNEPLTDLEKLPFFKDRLFIIQQEDAKPSDTKNILLFNLDYSKSPKKDWIIIIVGSDWDSWTKGEVILWSDGAITRQKDISELIESKSNIKYYNLFLRKEAR